MKKLFSTKYSAGAFNAAMLLLRVGLGVMMIPNGYNKLVNFAKYKPDFINFLGMGNTTSLALVVFAELFCAGLLILGLFTRLATIPLIITMLVAAIKAHHADFFGEGQHAALFALGFLVIFILGPGRISVDGAIGK
jgi:putative oxidoreductase